MRHIIAHIVVSLDGVFEGAAISEENRDRHISRFSPYRDEAYLLYELGQALACGALLMGRTTYEDFTRNRRIEACCDKELLERHCQSHL